MSGTRIPVPIVEYCTYMVVTDAYLLATPIGGTQQNYIRMNILPAEQTQWHGFATQAAALKLQWDAKTGNMTYLRDQIHLLRQQTHDYDKANHLLGRIANQSPTLALATDFTTFHIQENQPVVGTGLPTARKAATTKVPIFKGTSMGNGKMKFVCRVSETSKRAGKLKNYDEEVFYIILANADTTTTPVTPLQPVPTSTSGLTQHITETHAHFILDLGEDAVNHRIAVSIQWKHKTNPALDGSKSPIQVFTIGI